MKSLSASMQVQLLEAMLDGSHVAALVTDPSQEDNPIIFANRTFESLTGYTMDETLGRNCRFLQGKDTDPAAVNKIRTAIREKQPISITLKNYKKDGSMFWNRLSIKPLEVEGKLFFIGTQTNVTLERNQRNLITEKDREIEQLILPILMVQEDIAAVSLIGKMSRERLAILSTGLSEFVQETQVDHIILDITGIRWDDKSPLTTFEPIRNVLQLMGTQLSLTGVSPNVAQSLTALGESTKRLVTYPNIHHAIKSIHKRRG
ncbi:PAS domain-containing protein [Sporosarcina sp. OR05]|uniref:PAS domain-containing protein n=1 Tax=Sporosarcina sp. OR05 TaxID=2969819 RepID=UPI00352AC918